MVENILPDLYRIEIPLPGNPLKALNSYLIRGTDRNLLIDTGFNRPECKAALLNGLKTLNVDLEKTDIFITHLHADHSGLLSAIATHDTTVYCSKVDSNIINLTHDKTYWSDLQTAFEVNGFPLPELNEVISKHPGYNYHPEINHTFTLVKENDIIAVGDYKFICIETPGHTPGHICLYEPNKKVLISGDHILGRITPNISIEKWLPDPLGEYLSSLDKISQLEIRIALPGHRQLIDNAHIRIEELKKHHANRLDGILIILANARMNAYQVASKMTWSLTFKSWDKFPVTQRCFATGEAISHLIYLWKKGKVNRINVDGKLFFEKCT